MIIKIATMIVIETAFLASFSDSLIISQLPPSYDLKQTHLGASFISKHRPCPEQVSFWQISILDSQKLPL
jgi:hypothetical protein